MCGLWGAVGALGKVEDDRFIKQACIAGTLRGDHGTGVIEVTERAGKIYYSYDKEALPGWEFASKRSSALITQTATRALLGHNRYATSYLRGKEHAHPFKAEHILLMHNGVVDNVTELRDKYKLTLPYNSVDSEVLTAALAAGHAKEVLEEFRGAMALTWFDISTAKLHFARNEERPLWLAQAQQKFYYASEKEMLLWLLDRNDIKYASVDELPVGSILTLEVCAGEAMRPVLEEFKAAKRSRVTYNTAGGDYDDYIWPRASGATQTTTNTSTADTNPEGLTYTAAVAAVKDRLAKLGIFEDRDELWSCSGTSITAEGTAKCEFTLMRSPHSTGVCYVYNPSSINSKDDYARRSLFLNISRDRTFLPGAGYVNAKIGSIWLPPSWPTYTVADLVARGLYNISLKITSLSIFDEDTNTVWDYDTEASKFVAGAGAVNGLTSGLEYRVNTNLVNKALYIRWFAKSPYVVYHRPSNSEPDHVVVSPKSAPNVSFQVPKAALIGGAQ